MRAALAALIASLVCAAPAAAQTSYVAMPEREPGAGVCAGGLCQPEALTGLFAALAATEAGERTAPVHIVQIGDSHTAGDRITGATRAVLQRRFGAAGRGVLPVGVPYGGYAPMQVLVEVQDWRTATAPVAGRSALQAVDVGLAGVSPPTYGPAPLLRILPDPGASPSVLQVCGRAGPASTGFDVAIGDRRLPVDLTQPESGPLCWTLRVSAAGPVELRPKGANALAYSVMLQGDGPGVILSNLGVVSATLRDLAARDETVVEAELAAWRPTLLVLAFGTNEGFEDDLDAAAYEALLRGQIERMRRLAPRASLLILGAPDALRSGATNGCSADGVRAPPPSLAVVRDVQRKVAADLDVAFWDWHGRMGGDCSADRLALGAEPYMRGDRVHFTSAGANWIGGTLAGDLMAAYDRWKAERGSVD
ncbi:GDSL-type esterase/lipase family protein [Brevundimonas lenta]|uniref:Lysophospholipase L1-like esterase n=1 Tax=Brevundimonas lenta TaxID=424796 RepID=A0A7W6JEN3_9CAUL|nr:lysophospholipase L1-like esterase [Brevundimonas lenta]